MRALACAACLATLPLVACTIDVQKDEPGHKAVDIRTPVGSLSVTSDATAPDTGLPVYPGARPARDDDDDPQNADVNISSSLFGLKVRAAKYESDDPQETVVAFYRRELQSLGEVTECRGEVDFKGPRNAKRPVCKEKPFSRQIQLMTGTEDRRRIVAIQPRREGSQIGLVYIETRGKG